MNFRFDSATMIVPKCTVSTLCVFACVLALSSASTMVAGHSFSFLSLQQLTNDPPPNVPYALIIQRSQCESDNEVLANATGVYTMSREIDSIPSVALDNTIYFGFRFAFNISRPSGGFACGCFFAVQFFGDTYDIIQLPQPGAADTCRVLAIDYVPGSPVLTVASSDATAGANVQPFHIETRQFGVPLVFPVGLRIISLTSIAARDLNASSTQYALGGVFSWEAQVSPLLIFTQNGILSTVTIPQNAPSYQGGFYPVAPYGLVNRDDGIIFIAGQLYDGNLGTPALWYSTSSQSWTTPVAPFSIGTAVTADPLSSDVYFAGSTAGSWSVYKTTNASTTLSLVASGDCTLCQVKRVMMVTSLATLHQRLWTLVSYHSSEEWQLGSAIAVIGPENAFLFGGVLQDLDYTADCPSSPVVPPHHDDEGSSNDDKKRNVIIGVTVTMGILVIIAAAAVFFVIRKRRLTSYATV
eukprot:ANDGO_06398.mRNA.1 hypothetical protein